MINPPKPRSDRVMEVRRDGRCGIAVGAGLGSGMRRSDRKMIDIEKSIISRTVGA
jgi:hypothetical protein